MRGVFACGGTGGHINPAIAVARLIKDKRPDSEILFIGSGGMENRLVPSSGFEIRTIKSAAISRRGGISGIFANIASVRQVAAAEREAAKILKSFSPELVFGTGGYACYPALAAAAKLGIPTMVHESNAFPGLATRALSKRVSKILLNFEASREKLPKKANTVVVGNPIRGDILMYEREKARMELGVAKPLLVSFWGSLGAREMNVKIAEVMKLSCNDGNKFSHIHATGKYGYEWMPSLVEEKGIKLSESKDITLREYIDDMPRVLAAADVVMCRGGAGTLSEISARGIPAIIVPSPNVTDNHQFKNAMELEKIGGAIVIEEKDATAQLLYKKATELLENPHRRKEMSKALSDSAVLDASERIYSEICAMIKESK